MRLSRHLIAMKTEKELVVESLADLYRDMDKLDDQKDVGAIALRTGGYITLFNKYLAIAKKEYSEYPAITSIPETAPIQVQGIGQIPHLSGEAPPKFIATKLNIKAILNALNFDPSAPKTSQTTPAQVITRICNGFHLCARQLLRRRDERETLTINDEYDVQDLLHSLLVIFFDDVRPEENTPSYAGSSSRMDFLLKPERIVIEAKYDLRDKEVGNQLAVDITKYREHPDCKTLVCFVYDPKGQIRNPRGLESDLGRQSTEVFQVVVFVRP